MKACCEIFMSFMLFMVKEIFLTLPAVLVRLGSQGRRA